VKPDRECDCVCHRGAVILHVVPCCDSYLPGRVAPAEVRAVLTANHGKRVRVTWDDGVVQSVDVEGVDTDTQRE
jgi:hypothetical protein